MGNQKNYTFNHNLNYINHEEIYYLFYAWYTDG